MISLLSSVAHSRKSHAILSPRLVLPAMTRQTQRQAAPAATLLRAVLGGPRQLAGKGTRLIRTVRVLVSAGAIDERLDTLAARGYIDRRPTPAQIVFGSIDMFRWVIAPAARDYYEHKGLSFWFHQLLRVLDDPMSMIDPTGFLSDRDTIIGHVMQVVHLNPVYDLQLLEMFPDGLEQLETQVAQMVAGTHPRSGTIGAIVEDADYHTRLLDYVRAYRANPATAPDLVRQEQTLRRDPHFAAAERQFATLPGFIEYCHRLPGGLASLTRRLLTVRRYPIARSNE